MTKARNTREKTKPSSTLFKMLAASVSLMAAAVPVVGAFEHWFVTGATSGSVASIADYAKVCNLWNERHAERERQLAQFRSTFVRARDLTAARDALLLSVDQDITKDSELQASIEALTPGSNRASVQRRLEGDWKANLGALRRYRERLRVGLRSAAQLETIVIRYPESTIEERSAEARGQLLRVGGSACSLAQEHEQPAARWSPKLKQLLANVPPSPPLRAGPIGASMALVKSSKPPVTSGQRDVSPVSANGRAPALPTIASHRAAAPSPPQAETAVE